MKKLLQVNSVSVIVSTGRILDGISSVVEDYGWDTYAIYGRGCYYDRLNSFRNTTKAEVLINVMWQRFFDSDGFVSKLATQRAIDFIKNVNPDIIHFHNIHGYYLNNYMFLDFISSLDIPVVWTLHDCWSFTGRCSYFDNCMKWKTHCQKCPRLHAYPSSYICDNSYYNFDEKCRLIKKIKKLKLVPVSNWLNNLLKESSLADIPSYVIHNGINIDKFKPHYDTEQVKANYGITKDNVVLGVSSVWSKSKGFLDFIELSKRIDKKYQIVMVGVSFSQKKQLEKYGIIGITKTHSIDVLASLYSLSDVFVNPTYNDNYPTVNLEAISCGTPVITYATGGSPESVDENVGDVVGVGDINAVLKSIKSITNKNRDELRKACRLKAEKYFSDKHAFASYVELYNSLL